MPTELYFLDVESDIGDDLQTAENITTDNIVFSKIDDPGLGTVNDQDWYRLQLDANVTYTFDLEGVEVDLGEGFLLDPLNDPLLSLYNSAGVLVDSNDNISINDLNSRITYTPSSSDFYYVSATTGSGFFDVGGYKLSTSFSSVTPSDPFDPRVETDTDVVPSFGVEEFKLTPGQRVAATINNSNDTDAFLHDLTAGDTYIIFATSIGSNPISDPTFGYSLGSNPEIFDAAFLRDTKFTTFFSVRADQDTSSTINVSAAFGTDDQGNYLLSFVQAIALENNSDFVGNTIATAYGVSLESAVLGRINTSGDEDFYRLDVPENTSFVINLSNMADFGSGEFLTLSVFSLSGDLISSSVNSIGIVKMISAPSDGAVIIKVNGELGDSTSEYALSVFELYDFVSGDISTTQTVLVNGQIDGSIESSIDQDWYRVSLDTALNYNLEISSPFLSDLSSPSLVVYGEQGNKIVEYSFADFGTSADSVSAVFNPLTSGEYFIAVKQGDTGQLHPQGGDFRLSVTETNDPADQGDRPDPTVEITVAANLPFAAAGSVEINYSDLQADAEAPAIIYASVLNGTFESSVLGNSSSLGIFAFESDSGSNPITLTARTFGSVFEDTTTSYNVGIADPLATIDWSSQEVFLRPDFVSDAAWNMTYSNFLANVGSTVRDLSSALAEDARRIGAAGGEQQSVESALQFELEQAGDFGSLAERSEVGVLGKGWDSIADIGLQISNDGTISVKGFLDAGVFRSMDITQAAQYNVSLSVGKAVDGNGFLVTNNVGASSVFGRGENTDNGFTLVSIRNGYRITTADNDKFDFDRSGKLISVQPNASLEVIAIYNDEGQITGFENDLGDIITFTYDISGVLTNIVDEDGRNAEFQYSADNTVLLSVVTDRGDASFTYDVDGNLVSAQRVGGADIDFTYDSEGRLASQIIGGTVTENYTYDDAGAIFTTNSLGQVTTTQLGVGGNIVSQTNNLGETVSITNDSGSNIQTITRADGLEEIYTYNAFNFLEGIQDTNGNTISFEYDYFTQQISRFTDADGNDRSYTYDEDGRLLDAAWADGTEQSYVYDSFGNLITETNRRGDDVQFTRDARGNVTGESDSSDGEVTYTYDVRGNLVSAISDAGITSITYDSADRVTSIEYPNGRSLSYTYDGAGNRLSMVNQDGEGTFYSYDSAGRLLSVSDDNGVLTSYTYNDASQVTLESNRNGTETEYQYDGAGRQAAIINRDGDGNTSSSFVYEYDVLGRRISSENEDGTWEYQYDNIGQLVRAEFTSNTVDIEDTILTYDYDAAGNRISTSENGLITNYTTGDLNQYSAAGDKTFAYDADGNLTSQSATGNNYSYVYDVENRLTDVTKPDGTIISYEYDVFSNRSASIEDGVRTEFLVDPFGFGNVVGEYDNAGSKVASYTHGFGLVSRTAGDNSVAFYDADAVGNITGLTDATGTLVNEYHYTPFGRELFESETIANNFEFNGAFGVSEDAENLHYMRARSYDAETGRFLTEDPLFLDGDVQNLYRFGYNSPINFIDINGETPSLANAIWAAFPYAEGSMLGAFADVMAPGTDTDYSDALNVAAGVAFAAGFFVSFVPAVIIGGVAGTAYLFRDDLIGEAEASTNVEGLGWDISARAVGEPHYVTFDGTGYSFQAAGEFTMMRTIDGLLDVQVRQEPWEGRNDVSVNTVIAIGSGDDVLEIRAEDGSLFLNGIQFTLEDGAGSLIGANSVLVRDGNTYIFSDENLNGVRVDVKDGWLDIVPFLNDNMSGAVEGLLGNNDGNSDNDFILPDGTVLTQPIAVDVLYGLFADGWRVTDESSLFTYENGDTTETFTDLSFPDHIITLDDLDPDVRAAAEQIALDAGLQEGTFTFNTTVLDIAITGNVDFIPDTEIINTVLPIEVLDVQMAPVTSIDSAITDEDTIITVDVLANDSDPENDTLILLGGVDANGGVVTVVDNKLVVTPNTNFNGDTVVTYEVSDGQGNVSSGELNLTVNPVNDAPVQQDDAVSTDEDLAITIDVLANDSDIEGDDLAVSIATNAVHGSLVLNDDNTVTYTPNTDYNGTDSFTYTVSDGNGGTSIATVNLTIDPVNDTPISVVDLITTDEDAAIIINVLANDSDVDGDVLTVTSVAGALNGSVVINVDNTLIYTPNVDYNGSETLSYTIDDGNGGVVTEYVHITINPVNDAPVAQDDVFEGDQDINITGNLLSDNGNGADSDPDGDIIAVVAQNITTANGAVVISTNGNFIYTPNAGYFGTDSFSYTLEDGQGGVNTATANITLIATNRPPSAQDDMFDLTRDNELSGNVLLNDSDVDGDALTTQASVITTSQGGSVAMTSTGDFVYLPVLGFIGTDTFEYSVFDLSGEQDTASVTINVSARPDDIFGDDSTNILIGTNSGDAIFAEGGNDILWGKRGDDLLVGGEGKDLLVGNSGHDALLGGDGNDLLYGSSGNDYLFGGNGDDWMFGGSGSDALKGGAGNDYLYAGYGNDTLAGGLGVDTLKGGHGADTFIFDADSAYDGIDTIKDFKIYQGDAIDISDLLEGYDELTDVISDFVQITDNGTHSTISIDADGGADNFVQVASLLNVTGLTDEDALETSGNLITT